MTLQPKNSTTISGEYRTLDSDAIESIRKKRLDSGRNIPVSKAAPMSSPLEMAVISLAEGTSTEVAQSLIPSASEDAELTSAAVDEDTGDRLIESLRQEGLIEDEVFPAAENEASPDAEVEIPVDYSSFPPQNKPSASPSLIPPTLRVADPGSLDIDIDFDYVEPTTNHQEACQAIAKIAEDRRLLATWNHDSSKARKEGLDLSPITWLIKNSSSTNQSS